MSVFHVSKGYLGVHSRLQMQDAEDHLLLASLSCEMRPQQPPVASKVFIQRDYSSGTKCQFQTKFPPELENRVLKKIAKYIQEQNEKIYAPQGLLLTDPIERGLRVIEITIYEDRSVTSGR
ncbi:golgin subfamily A member 7 isoform 3-T3 [Vipera latastei]